MVEDLLRRYTDTGLRWAMAGRSRARLDAVRSELGAESVPLIVADSHDPASLDNLVGQTGVVAATVGPYALHGSELVTACTRRGTHYCDLTGEVQWIRQMIDQYDRPARETGTRLVHCCGFDSIPSDLGCLMMNRTMIEHHGGPCEVVKLGVRHLRGGVSGGTVASMLNLVEQARRDPGIRRLVAHPYALNPIDQREGADGTDQRGVEWDADFRSWTAPFVMAGINTRIVRRSNALSRYAYGRDFRYGETLLTGRGSGGCLRAMLISAGLAAALTGVAFRPTRALLNRFVLPQPGEGPSQAQRAAGHFDLELVGRRGDQVLRGRVTGREDPGYGATAKMLTETAVCLARDGDKLPVGGGSWTPATAMGTRLMERLQAAGIVQFQLESD